MHVRWEEGRRVTGRSVSGECSSLTLWEEVCNEVMVGHVSRVELQSFGVMHGEVCPQFRVCEGICRVQFRTLTLTNTQCGAKLTLCEGGGVQDGEC